MKYIILTLTAVATILLSSCAQFQRAYSINYGKSGWSGGLVITPIPTKIVTPTK